jgi:hypothetical protein
MKRDPNLVRSSIRVSPRMSMRVFDLTGIELSRRGVEYSQDGYFMGQSNFYVYSEADANTVCTVVAELEAVEWA